MNPYEPPEGELRTPPEPPPTSRAPLMLLVVFVLVLASVLIAVIAGFISNR